MSASTSRAVSVPAASALAVTALLFNAFVWGVSWWPLRWLHAAGLHPLWATALVYAAVVLIIVLRWPQAFRQLLGTPVLWVLACAAGTTNATFNWAVSIGDVVRVLLLFYLMPLWSLLLARWLLGERLHAWAALRIVLALMGAAIVLKPAGAGWPLPSSLPDWLGIAGGFSFALNNVMLKREARQPPEARALAMFLGGMLVAGGVAVLLGAAGIVPAPAMTRGDWVLPVLGLTAAMLAANLSLQYGAQHLRASTMSVIMLTEVVFASGSAVLLGDQVLTAPLLLGGALIVAAAALSAFETAPARSTGT
jgi:drug/metabolite transporter (DMT)-like permease